MNKTLNSLFGAMLLASSASVFAASSTDLTVTGFITPSACEPSLSNGGIVDYAKIPVKDLNADRPTELGQQILQLSITCNEPALAAFEAKDNREGSSFQNDINQFGLGLINTTEKLGGMYLHLTLPMADGLPVRSIDSEDGGMSWNFNRELAHNNIISVSEASAAAPIPFKAFSANLHISPSIAPTNQLTLDEEVRINGSVTLTVRYL